MLVPLFMAATWGGGSGAAASACQLRWRWARRTYHSEEAAAQVKEILKYDWTDRLADRLRDLEFDGIPGAGAAADVVEASAPAAAAAGRALKPAADAAGRAMGRPEARAAAGAALALAALSAGAAARRREGGAGAAAGAGGRRGGAGVLPVAAAAAAMYWAVPLALNGFDWDRAARWRSKVRGRGEPRRGRGLRAAGGARVGVQGATAPAGGARVVSPRKGGRF